MTRSPSADPSTQPLPDLPSDGVTVDHRDRAGGVLKDASSNGAEEHDGEVPTRVSAEHQHLSMDRFGRFQQAFDRMSTPTTTGP